tara:strand:- start:320 stop:565 length:246 start_codon:yes stop_codon:yes gene_type:complete
MKKSKRKFNIKVKPSDKRPDLMISLNGSSMLYKIVDNFFNDGSKIDDMYRPVVNRLEHSIENFNKLEWETKVILLDVILKL